ncbi:MAG: aldo/keto reductase [Trueperaceae bacterium]
MANPHNHSDTFLLGGELEVHRLGFGAMRITGVGIWGPPADGDEARRVLRRAVELGIDLIDTADSYGPNVSEELIAEALHPYPDGLVIATKGGQLRPGPDVWKPDGRPEHLRAVLEGSLQRLRLERIDLYQLHRPDPKVPLKESVGALAEWQREGLIRFIGLSNVSVEQLDEARAVAEIVTVQNRYNVSYRTSQPVLERCQELGIGFIPWQPIGAGDLGEAVERVAARHGATPAQVALAWLLQSSPVQLPIPGTSSVRHLEENVAATELQLDDDDMEALGA